MGFHERAQRDFQKSAHSKSAHRSRNSTRAPRMKKSRDKNGRFTPGNPGGPGNPHAGQVAKLRAAILDAVGTDDVVAIIAQLVRKAREGDLAAAREVLDRSIGKSGPSDLLERIEALEAIAERVQAEGSR